MDSEDLAKLVKETDDLDSNLFGDTYKKQKSSETSSKNPTTESIGKIRKKVVFKDYNEDDPLADLLSDEEDFEPHKQQSVVTSSNKSSIIADLFGLKTSDTSEFSANTDNKQSSAKSESVNKESARSIKPVKPLSKENDWLGLQDEPVSNLLKDSILLQSTQKAITVDGTDKSLSATNANSSKSKIMDDKAKKSSLIEDLFGSRPKSSTSLDDKSSTKGISKITSSKSMSDLSKAERTSTPFFGGYAPSASTNKEPRRGRRTSVIDDPLGLLSSTSIEQPHPSADVSKKDFTTVPRKDTESEDISSKNVLPDLPEWLGGKKNTNLENSGNTNQPLESNKPQSSTDKGEAPAKNVSTTGETVNGMQSYPNYMSILMGSEVNQQAAIMTMQQQEHELRTATMLSQQNQQLSNLLDRQKLQLSEQEKQFNVLIQKQIERQMLLETQMKMHQDRINHYIEALMAQPSSTLLLNTAKKDGYHTVSQDSVNTEENSESLVKKLQLENTYLENTLESLKEKHDREMTLLEESYRKQITLLEESMEKTEKRMRSDTERLEADYETKIEKLKDERAEIESTYKQQIEQLKKVHKEYVEEINQSHANNVAFIIKQQSEVVENMSKVKGLENEAVINLTTHKPDIYQLLEKANVIIDDLTNVQKKVEDKNNKLDEEKQISLKILEENLEKQKRYIDSQTAILEKERHDVINAAKSIDSNLGRLMTELQEKGKQIRETEERLKVKEEFLIRERELFEERIKWEQDHLQSLKDSWTKEKERELKALAKEKDTIIEERAKIDVFNKLKINIDDSEKLELAAALKAARDAVAYAHEEKQKWMEKLQRLGIQQQSLQEKETQLMLRAKELQELTQSAVAKREEGLRALKEAKRIENYYKQKLQQLQTQIEALAQQENKIAAEKLSLARERLALHTVPIEKPEKEVSAHIVRNVSEKYLPITETKMEPGIVAHFKDVIDPRLVMLKLNIDSQLDTSNN